MLMVLLVTAYGRANVDIGDVYYLALTVECN
jgi:hypothetical protein